MLEHLSRMRRERKQLEPLQNLPPLVSIVISVLDHSLDGLGEPLAHPLNINIFASLEQAVDETNPATHVAGRNQRGLKASDSRAVVHLSGCRRKTDGNRDVGRITACR